MQYIAVAGGGMARKPRSETISVRIDPDEKALLMSHAARAFGAEGTNMTAGQAARSLAFYATTLIDGVVQEASATLTLADLYRLAEVAKSVGPDHFRSGNLLSLAITWASGTTADGATDTVLDRFLGRIRALPPTHATHLAFTVGFLVERPRLRHTVLSIPVANVPPSTDLDHLRIYGIAPAAASWPATVSTWSSHEEWWQADERRRPGVHGGTGGGPTFGVHWFVPGGRYLIEWIKETGEIAAFQNQGGEQVHVLGVTEPHGLDWRGGLRGKTTDAVAITLFDYERHMRTVGAIYELARELTALTAPG
jgi:hypothetical protein